MHPTITPLVERRVSMLMLLLIIRKKSFVKSRLFVLIPLALQRMPNPLKQSVVGWMLSANLPMQSIRLRLKAKSPLPIRILMTSLRSRISKSLLNVQDSLHFLTLPRFPKSFPLRKRRSRRRRVERLLPTSILTLPLKWMRRPKRMIIIAT